jgi:hypothetical protein
VSLITTSRDVVKNSRSQEMERGILNTKVIL